MPRSLKTVPAPASQPATTIQNQTEQNKQSQQQQKQQQQQQQQQKRIYQAIRPHMSKRTSNAAHMDADDDANMDLDGFNDYNDNNADHMGISDDDISQPPIAKGLPTKFMFRGMRGQRQYDVPQIG